MGNRRERSGPPWLAGWLAGWLARPRPAKGPDQDPIRQMIFFLGGHEGELRLFGPSPAETPPLSTLNCTVTVGVYQQHGARRGLVLGTRRSDAAGSGASRLCGCAVDGCGSARRGARYIGPARLGSIAVAVLQIPYRGWTM